MAQPSGIEGTYGWIPYHVVACSSQEFGSEADLLSDQAAGGARSWESERLGQFPVELVLRLHYRYSRVTAPEWSWTTWCCRAGQTCLARTASCR